MSQSRACQIVQTLPGEWFLVVAKQEGEERLATGTCTVVGPFENEVIADEYLSEYFTNPGMVRVVRNPAEMSADVREAVKVAEFPDYEFWMSR